MPSYAGTVLIFTRSSSYLSQPQAITDELLRFAHTQGYIDEVAATPKMSNEDRVRYMQNYDNVFFNKVVSVVFSTIVNSDNQ